MKITHTMLNDLLDRVPRPSGVLYLSQDTDPHALVAMHSEVHQ